MHKTIKISLNLVDGNAFSILAVTKKQALEQGLSKEEWKVIQDKTTAKDYHYLLMTILQNFDVVMEG
ncbi:MAG: hypothetical protein JW812_03440 [Alphaproteobacteria bacterium]|nr:hypothetical protein [Alphaproteobacteria bacterium]